VTREGAAFLVRINFRDECHFRQAQRAKTYWRTHCWSGQTGAALVSLLNDLNRVLSVQLSPDRTQDDVVGQA
jgi:hypothetical protein